MTRDELIAAMKADEADMIIPIEIKRWGTVYVRPISVEEAERTGRSTKEGEDGEQRSQFAVMAAQMICDESGNRLFDPDNPDDVRLLATRRSADLMQIINAGTATGN